MAKTKIIQQEPVAFGGHRWEVAELEGEIKDSKELILFLLNSGLVEYNSIGGYCGCQVPHDLKKLDTNAVCVCYTDCKEEYRRRYIAMV